ncbi:putative PKS/NRPS-like protein biosynthetic cluster [Aspergillus udagawae]|uniref:PKS/NRPS-like protein biosynthetic cluster n=1 Tax=Aspergillus udagawae TaxID=91492 RepID=A0A8E0QTP1_9EURO|nr:putative PKS/NRPS-like protein biosynthetic cluster [Aspergillus udagawae]GIC90969.1 putative PKS/NRPS-like protein biosynthetic cluster [Aspergillus udagawae]
MPVLVDDVLTLPEWQNAQEGKVFLTGATGFAGAYMLARLLSMPTVKKVACLARGRGEQTPANRIQQALEKYRLWDGSLERAQKIIVIEGDLADDALGMAEDQYRWLPNGPVLSSMWEQGSIGASPTRLTSNLMS